MIPVKRLRELLAQLPDDARCHAYEGEDVGIAIRDVSDKRWWWIRARDSVEEDDQTEFRVE